jgi:hypothetical protein
MELFALLLLACGLAGCFQIDQVVTVSPDGSGTLEETFMISRKIGESMAAFTAGMGEQAGSEGDKKPATKEQSFFKDDEIKKRAENFGPDVRFVEMRRVANADFEGYKAVYSFRDINKLNLDQGNAGMPKQMDQGSDAAPKKGIKFLFTPGKTATLIVKQQKNEQTAGETAAEKNVPAPETAEPARETTAEELAMVRQMFGGFRIATSIVIKGKVIETNATHRNNSTITLADVDFSKILDKPELLAKMSVLQSGDQAAMMELFKKMPGMKFDMNDELKISFR